MDISGNPSEQQSSQVGGRATSSKTKRYLVAAALLTGGLTVGAFFSPVGLAGAQSDDTVEEDTDTDSGTTDENDDSEGNESGHRRGRRGGHARFGNVADILGISQAELRAQFGEGLTLAEIAEAQGVSTEALVAELVDAMEEHLDAAVAEDRIDQDTADERLAGAEGRIEEFVNQAPGEHAGDDHGRRGPGRGGRAGQGLAGQGLGEVAETLGLSIDDLRAGFADGQTLAESAAAQGVSETDLVDALVEAATARIDEAVEADRIDGERAAELKESLEEKVAELVNREPGDGHRRGPGAGGRGFGHGEGSGQGRGFGGGFGHGADDGADVEESSFSA